MNKRRFVGCCVLMHMCIWNSMPVWISYRSFWQKWNFISGDKICKHHPKWNAYTCPSKYRVTLNCNRNETSCEQNLFSRRFVISKWYEFISPLIWTYSKRYERFGYSTKPMSFVQTVWIINSYRLLLPKNDFLHSEIKDVLRNFLNIYDGAKMFNIKSYNNRSLIIT